jgi:cytochrome c
MDHIKTRTLAIIAATLAAMTVNTAAMADSHMMSPGLMMPQMDPENGRALFASKGCVVCHSVNGIGGEDARMLGAEFMEGPMNPFEFAARMWRGAEVMMTMQREELGAPIELTGQELADIIAFVHDADEQAKFSHEDIPENIEKLIAH